MLAGRIKCDFCDFVGEMVSAGTTASKGSLSVPAGWVGIHPTIVLYGKRGLERGTADWHEREKIKNKLKEKVGSIHCCPRCLQDRDVFDVGFLLPEPAKVTRDNCMRKS